MYINSNAKKDMIHNKYDYCFWSSLDEILPLEINDIIALKPHSAKDSRGVYIGSESDGIYGNVGICKMNLDGRERRFSSLYIFVISSHIHLFFLLNRFESKENIS